MNSLEVIAHYGDQKPFSTWVHGAWKAEEQEAKGFGISPMYFTWRPCNLYVTMLLTDADVRH